MRIILICLCKIVVGGRYSFEGVWGVSRLGVFIFFPCLSRCVFILILVLVEILRVGIGLFLISLSYF